MARSKKTQPKKTETATQSAVPGQMTDELSIAAEKAVLENREKIISLIKTAPEAQLEEAARLYLSNHNALVEDMMKTAAQLILGRIAGDDRELAFLCKIDLLDSVETALKNRMIWYTEQVEKNRGELLDKELPTVDAKKLLGGEQ